MEEFEFSKKLMGCEFDVSIISDSEEKAQKAFEEIFQLGKKYENIFSRFLEDSELSVLNQKKDLKVSKIFWKVFKEAEKLYQESFAKFNPLVDISRFGYNKSFDLLPEKINSCVDCDYYSVDFSRIKMNSYERRIILEKDQNIDMGGFLKGYLSENMANILAKDFSGAIVNIGGDLTARGKDENKKVFEFSLWNPVNEIDIEGIFLEDMSMSTSGNYKRKWKISGKEVHHILDSKGNDNPESDLVSATIISERGSESDAYATVLMGMKSNDALGYCRRKSLNCILLTKNNKLIKNI